MPPFQIFLLALLLLLAAGGATEAREYYLGARPPTAQERAYLDAVCTKVTKVEPNALSRERARAEAARARLQGLPPAPVAVRPAAVDNSILPSFPPIGAQGNQGSCSCWAAAYYYNTYTQARDEGYNVSGGDTNHICSPGFLYPLINKGKDRGAYVGMAMERLNHVGCASWALQPYSDSDYTSWPSEAAWIQALQNRTQTTSTISGSSPAGLEAIRQHLANGNVAVTQFYLAYSFFDYPDEGSGASNNVYYYWNGYRYGGHAVALVGYDDNKAYVDHRDGQAHYGAFLVANSWGPSWGVTNSTGSATRGFFWVAYQMFLEGTFGPEVYYNADRPSYRPALYGVAGINHAQRGYLELNSSVGSGPDWSSHPVIDHDGGTSIPVTDAKRIAVDMTDGADYVLDSQSATLCLRLTVALSATSNGTITSADFYDDLDHDGIYRRTSSADPTLTVSPGSSGYARATIPPPAHTVTVSASGTPTTIPSGGTTSLTASASCSYGHTISSWTWSESGAAGAFSPSRYVQNPTWTGPGNTTRSPIQRPLTVTATCAASTPASGTATVAITENRVVHTLSVHASASPTAVPSGGSTQLSATASDTLGHGIACWSWTDNGAGGTFSPSRYVQNPTYTGSGNSSGSPVQRALSVTALCSDLPPVSGRGSIVITENYVAHVISVTASANPTIIEPGGTTQLNANASDTLGHSIAAWHWSDQGAGGTFSPSATAQNPTYTAPMNTTADDQVVSLTVTARCNSGSAASGSATTEVVVHPRWDFSDVPHSHWAFREIHACCHAGIVAGYLDGAYKPEWVVRRDEMAVYISRALAGGDAYVPDGPETPSFADVPKDSWTYKYVEYAVTRGVVSDCDDELYHPDWAVNRAQMSVFVARSLAGGDEGVPAGPADPSFSDVTEANEWSWCYKYVEYIVAENVTRGYDDGKYHPEREVTRDQMAVYIQRAFELPM